MVTSEGPNRPRQPYIFANSEPEAPTQLRLLAQMLDPGSTAVLREVGAQPGQQWLDVGAGAGSISHWLASEVGPTGHVTALDIDPRHIRPADNLTIVTRDVRDIDLPDGAYHGIHARLVTMHLSDPEQTLGRLAGALVSGGVLVVSEWDCDWRDLIRVSPNPHATALVNKFLEVSLALGQAAGVDLGWAKQVLQAMVDLGLLDVHTRTESRSWNGGAGICLLHRSNTIARGDLLLRAGITTDELHRLRELMLDPNLVLSGYLMHTTVGWVP